MSALLNDRRDRGAPVWHLEALHATGQDKITGLYKRKPEDVIRLKEERVDQAHIVIRRQ
jgi:hypothetical protein